MAQQASAVRQRDLRKRKTGFFAYIRKYWFLYMLVLPEVMRFVGLPDAVAANMREIIYGLLLIILMYFRPQGLAGEYAVK